MAVASFEECLVEKEREGERERGGGRERERSYVIYSSSKRKREFSVVILHVRSEIFLSLSFIERMVCKLGSRH